MITAKIIEDSVAGPNQVRLTTFQLEYPRYIHGELMTHRVFSRNASSSRATPLATTIQKVLKNPVVPVRFAQNQKGMQSGAPLTGIKKWLATKVWLWSRYFAIMAVKLLAWIGVSKEIGNRLLEPWSFIQVVLTSTDFANFYALRNHPDAQPEIQELARAMLAAHEASIPVSLGDGDWHLPYVSLAERVTYSGTVMYDILLPKLSAARCARVSYWLRDGKEPNIEDDIKLFERLADRSPIHASPLEHAAQVDLNVSIPSNFRPPWKQFRKMIPNDTVTEYKGLR